MQEYQGARKVSTESRRLAGTKSPVLEGMLFSIPWPLAWATRPTSSAQGIAQGSASDPNSTFPSPGSLLLPHTHVPQGRRIAAWPVMVDHSLTGTNCLRHVQYGLLERSEGTKVSRTGEKKQPSIHVHI